MHVLTLLTCWCSADVVSTTFITWERWYGNTSTLKQRTAEASQRNLNLDQNQTIIKVFWIHPLGTTIVSVMMLHKTWGAHRGHKDTGPWMSTQNCMAWKMFSNYSHHSIVLYHKEVYCERFTGHDLEEWQYAHMKGEYERERPRSRTAQSLQQTFLQLQ